MREKRTSTWCKRNRTSYKMVRQRTLQARKGKGRVAVARQRTCFPPIFGVTEWLGSSHPTHLLKQIHGRGFLKVAYTTPIIRRSRRQIQRQIVSGLETIHPNPGAREARDEGSRSHHARDRGVDMFCLSGLLYPEKS